MGPRARARLVVLKIEVAGRWSEEARQFVGLRVKPKASQEGWSLRRRAEQAWRMRWSSIISCSVARAVAESWLELLRVSGADGDKPLTHDVERDFQHVCLALWVGLVSPCRLERCLTLCSPLIDL